MIENKAALNETEISIDFLELVSYLWKHIVVIAVVTLMGGIICFLYSKYNIKPLYESTTSVYILSSETEITYYDTVLATSLSNDIGELIVSHTVLESVIDELELDMTYTQLKGNINVDAGEDARVIYISARNGDPEMAKMIVDAVRRTAAEFVVDIMHVSAVNTIDEGVLPRTPSSPSVKRWALVGAFAAALIICGVYTFFYMMDDTIKNEDEIEKYLGTTVLARVPVLESEKQEHTNQARRKE